MNGIIEKGMNTFAAMRIASFILILLSSYWYPVVGQETENSPLRLGLKYGRGFMITHSPIMEYVSDQHFNKSELVIEKQLNGSKDWHERYGFPHAGISISHYNFEKKEFFGEAYSISAYYSFPFLKKNSLSICLRPSAGAGWIQTPFDINDNFKNVAIGSRLNIYVSLLAEAEWFLSDQWGVSFGVDFSHFSNTGFKYPNLGINLPNATIGLKHQFGKNSLIHKTEKEPSPAKLTSDFLQFRWGNGITENHPVGGPKFVASALSIEWEKELNFKSSVGAGVDFFYNPGQKAKLAQDSIFIDGGWENLQIGLSLHHLLNFGKLGLGVKAGAYVKKKDNELNNFYQEVYGQHPIWKNWSVIVSMKTHLLKAEYLIYGVKYSLR